MKRLTQKLLSHWIEFLGWSFFSLLKKKKKVDLVFIFDPDLLTKKFSGSHISRKGSANLKIKNKKERKKLKQYPNEMLDINEDIESLAENFKTMIIWEGFLGLFYFGHPDSHTLMLVLCSSRVWRSKFWFLVESAFFLSLCFLNFFQLVMSIVRICKIEGLFWKLDH